MLDVRGLKELTGRNPQKVDFVGFRVFWMLETRRLTELLVL